MYKFLGNYDFDFTINLQDFKFRDNKVNHYDDSFDTGMRVAELLSDVCKLNIDESDK